MCSVITHRSLLVEAAGSSHRSLTQDLRDWMIFAPFVFPRPKQQLLLKIGSLTDGFGFRRCKGKWEEAKLRSVGEDIRLPQTKPCCVVPHVALSNGRGSMGLRPKRARNEQRKLSGDAEVTKTVGRIDDPMVEVHPITLDLSITDASSAVSASANLSNSVSVATKRFLDPLFFTSRGSTALAYSAAGAFAVMMIAAAVRSLRSQPTNVSNLAVSPTQAFDLTLAREANYVQESAHSSKASFVRESDIQDFSLRRILEVTSELGAQDQIDLSSLSQNDYMGEKEVDVESNPELVSHRLFFNAADADILQTVSSSPRHSAEDLRPLPSTDEELLTDNVMNKAQGPIAAAGFSLDQMIGENHQKVTSTKVAEQIPSTNLEHLSAIVTEDSRSVAEEQYFQIESPSEYDPQGHSLSQQPLFEDRQDFQNRSNPESACHNHSNPESPAVLPTHASDTAASADRKRRLEARKALQTAAPALTIGAGALGLLTGTNGGLEMVGMAAAASFISYELLWAQTREVLWQEILSITDRQKLLHFLKARKILKD